MEAGCRDALAEGPLGHPVTGLRVTLTDGATHPKDSSEMAFRTAGRLGLREALRASVMQLLEPVAEVAVTAPNDAMGGVLCDLAARRGHVLDATVRAGTAVVTATVPLAELFGYANRLRSGTQGRGTFTARPTGYVPAPPGQRPGAAPHTRVGPPLGAALLARGCMHRRRPGWRRVTTGITGALPEGLPPERTAGSAIWGPKAWYTVIVSAV